MPHHAPHGGAPPCCSANCRRILANRASGGSLPCPHVIDLEQVEQGGAAKRVWDGAVQRVVVQIELQFVEEKGVKHSQQARE